MSAPTLAEILERDMFDYDDIAAFYARAKALAEKWEARAGHWRKEDDSVALAAAATQCEICAAELRNLTGDLQP